MRSVGMATLHAEAVSLTSCPTPVGCRLPKANCVACPHADKMPSLARRLRHSSSNHPCCPSLRLLQPQPQPAHCCRWHRAFAPLPAAAPPPACAAAAAASLFATAAWHAAVRIGRRTRRSAAEARRSLRRRRRWCRVHSSSRDDAASCSAGLQR